MEQHNFQQGTPEWHKHRATHFNASDAPAMLGISPYETRSQLLHRLATGIVREVDLATQRRFDDGHRCEALARPLAEKIIGKKLFPIVASEGKLSASFDGLTMDEVIGLEHKKLNNDIRQVFANNKPLLEYHRCQMEQELMIAEACKKILFMASDWDDDGNLIGEALHRWYISDQEMRERIMHGWVQFAIDLENYVPPVIIEKPQAEAIMDLPALSVQATGMVTYSNLPEFKASAEAYIAKINTSLQTDEDFANAEATVKFCNSTEERLEVTKSAILAQTATIDEVIRTVDHIQAQLRDKRLMLDKLVKSEKDARKLAIVSKAGIDFTAHIQALESETRPIQLTIQRPDFGGAIKGMKKLEAMQDAVDTALANGKIHADTVAKDVRAKLTWCKENSAGYGFLFNDLAQIIGKPMDDFQLVVTSRIDAHKAAEAAKLEAEREAMRIEEEAKAKAKIEAEAAAKLAEENSLIESLWKEARRIEFNSTPYIEKAIASFETCAKDWENDHRPRVAHAVSEARKEMQEKLAIAKAAESKAQANHGAEQQATAESVTSAASTQPVKDAAVRPAVVWPLPMKRGSITLARSLCYEIAGPTDEDDDMTGGGYGSVDIAEILSAEVERLRAAICQTLDANGHLADGDVCTLLPLKLALRESGAPWGGDELHNVKNQPRR